MIKLFERIIHRLSSAISMRRFKINEAQRQIAEQRIEAVQGIDLLEPRIDPDTLTTSDWLKVLETQEKRIAKLRDQNIELREQISELHREMNGYKRSLELVGFDARRIR